MLKKKLLSTNVLKKNLYICWPKSENQIGMRIFRITYVDDGRNKGAAGVVLIHVLFRNFIGYKHFGPNGIYTHILKKSLACLPARLAKIQSPLDHFLSNKNLNNNNL